MRQNNERNTIRQSNAQSPDTPTSKVWAKQLSFFTSFLIECLYNYLSVRIYVTSKTLSVYLITRWGTLLFKLRPFHRQTCKEIIYLLQIMLILSLLFRSPGHKLIQLTWNRNVSTLHWNSVAGIYLYAVFMHEKKLNLGFLLE